MAITQSGERGVVGKFAVNIKISINKNLIF